MMTEYNMWSGKLLEEVKVADQRGHAKKESMKVGLNEAYAMDRKRWRIGVLSWNKSQLPLARGTVLTITNRACILPIHECTDFFEKVRKRDMQ